MDGKFDASTPEKITEFALEVLKEFQVSVSSEWKDGCIVTTVENPLTNKSKEIESYPSPECDISMSEYMIQKMGKELDLQKKRRGLYLL